MRPVTICCLSIALLAGLALFAQPKGKGGGDAAKGKAVFEQCSVCHDPASTEKKTGPGLKGLFSRAKLHNGKKPTEANVMAVVEAGGNGMPEYKDLLSPQEKKDLLAYLKTL